MMSQSTSNSKRLPNKKKIEPWTQRETLCFLKLLTKNQMNQVINGQKIDKKDIFKELKVQMKKNGYNKSDQQMEVKLKNLQEGYHKRKRNNIPSKIDKYMKDLNIFFSCGPKDTADLYLDSIIDFDEEQNERPIIMENRIAKELENSDTTRPEVVEVRLPEEIEDNRKQNINNDQSSNVKMLDHQPTFQMNILNQILEKQQSFMIQVLENQRQICLEMQAKYIENLKSQSKVLMDGFLSELKLLRDSKK